MNLHEAYASLVSEMPKLNWKRDALSQKAINQIKKATEFPAYIMYDYKIPSSFNQYIIYFYCERRGGPILGGYLFVMYDGGKRFIIKWGSNGTPEIHILTSHFLKRYKERFLKQPELAANEAAVIYLSRNQALRPMAIDERINKNISEYGEFAGEGFLVKDGFCFKLSGEESKEGEERPIKISFYTTFMPLSEMSESQRDAIYEECMKDFLAVKTSIL